MSAHYWGKKKQHSAESANKILLTLLSVKMIISCLISQSCNTLSMHLVGLIKRKPINSSLNDSF